MDAAANPDAMASRGESENGSVSVQITMTNGTNNAVGSAPTDPAATMAATAFSTSDTAESMNSGDDSSTTASLALNSNISGPVRRQIRIVAGPGLRITSGPGGVRTLNAGPGVRVSAGPGVTVNVGGLMTMNQRAANGTRGGPSLTVPSLEPQVLPESNQEFNEHGDRNKQDMGHFKCNICLEFMNLPAGCGKCSARFCCGCLRKAAQPFSATSGSAGNTNPEIRCPACRSLLMGVDDIQTDDDLKRRIERMPPIPCRYKDCQVHCQLSKLADHEAECPHVRMQCKYRSFGCTWNGKRQDLSAHEESTCHLARVSGFVESHRRMHAEFTHLMAHLQHAIGATGARIEVERAIQTHQQQPIPSNLLQLFQFVHMVTCHPAQYIAKRETYQLFDTVQGRATVVNVLMTFPTALFLLCTFLNSYRQLIQRGSTDLDSDEAFFDFLDAMLNFLIMGSLGLIIGLLCYVDIKAPQDWCTFTIPGTRMPPAPLVGYAVTVAFGVALRFAMGKIVSEPLRAVPIFLLLGTISTTLPCVVLAVILGVANSGGTTVTPRAHAVLLDTGRLARPLLMALRYGLAPAFPYISVVDSVVLLEGYVADAKTEHLASIFLLLRIAMIVHDPGLDSLMAVFFFVFTKLCIDFCLNLGSNLGGMVAISSRQSEYSGLGVAIFASVCLMTALMIVATLS